MGLRRNISRFTLFRSWRLRWVAHRYGRDVADLKWLTEDCTGERGDFLLPLRSASRVAFHLDRYRFACRHSAGKAVADIACGTGYGTWLLRDEGQALSVAGLDIGEMAIQYGNKYYARSGIGRATGDARCLPLTSGCVDLVVSFETIEHVTEGERIVAEFQRILRPGGRLIISTPNDWGVGGAHVATYDYDGFLALLSPCFQITEVLAQYSEKGCRKHNMPERIVPVQGTREKETAGCFIAVAEKH